MSSENNLLEVQHINHVYGSGEKSFTAVQDINLSLTEGEFVALLGPSGCGKSTLLRIITGLQLPTEGQVLYRGVSLKGVNPHATIVFQTFALFPWLTVQENVEAALKPRKIIPKLRTARALDLLDRVGMDGFETAYPRELSGGMRQKVGFARAMAVEPELLCLDEAFSALDVLSASSLRSDLLELWTSGNIPTRAILMVTHDIEEAIFMADRIVVMDKQPGRIIANLRVDLPRPRSLKAPQFLGFVDKVYALLAGQTQPEYIEMGVAPGDPGGQTRPLPNIAISNLSSLLEQLDEMINNKADIYQLADELRINSDQMLCLTEATELLGFATIAQGDITLTSLGETFAEASIAAQKEIFATRIRRLPIFKWLLSLLYISDKRQIEWDIVLSELEMEFPPKEAKQQLLTAINWGRYAEILAYDDDTEAIYLEPAGMPLHHPIKGA